MFLLWLWYMMSWIGAVVMARSCWRAARTDVAFTMSGSEVVRYDLPPLLVDTALPTTSGCVRVRYHEI